MKKYLTWLGGHRNANILILCTYFLAVVLPHKRFGTFINEVLFKGVSRDDSNLLVALLFFGLFMGFGLMLMRNSRSLHFDRWLLMAFVINTILAVALVHVLFVNNIEMVHYPQYFLLTFLLFPLLNNYTQTMIVAVVLGVLDESYQYFYLAPMDTSYYDFNDILTDLVGVVFGLLFLRSLGLRSTAGYSWKSSPATLAIGGLVLFLVTALATDFLSIYPSDTSTFQLLQKIPPDFWSHVPPKVKYHVMLPMEGSLIVIAAMVFFAMLIRRSEHS